MHLKPLDCNYINQFSQQSANEIVLHRKLPPPLIAKGDKNRNIFMHPTDAGQKHVRRKLEEIE
jgi:hypothetical protein